MPRRIRSNRRRSKINVLFGCGPPVMLQQSAESLVAMNWETVTSYDAVSSGGIVNQIEYAYDDFARLIQEYQSHSGGVVP